MRVFKIFDKYCIYTVYNINSGKSKGYGFVTFKDVDSAYAALKVPVRHIDVSLHSLYTSIQCST